MVWAYIVSAVNHRSKLYITMEIYNVFRRDETNAGDWFSPAFRYFSFLGEKTIDIFSDEIPEAPSILVFGGGGLISPDDSFQRIQRFFDAGHNCIAWGLGENWTINKDDGFLTQSPLYYPEWLSKFNVLGMRDFCNPGEHVPCASCFHPAFDKKYEVTREYGVYQHKRIPIPSMGHEVNSNDGADMDAKIAFLGGCETVITNSYHGIYWAKLLGKKVISIPFASKFYGIDESIKHCPPWDIDLSRVSEADENRLFLAECRQKNELFAEMVKNYIASV